MSNRYQNLLSPLKIGSIEIKNRFCMAPMGGAGVYGAKGQYTEQGLQYFVERAKGGFGLIFTGAMMPDMEVDPFSPIEGNSPMYSPGNFRRQALKLNERVDVYGTKVFAQLSMGLGRNYPGLHAPSELPVFFDPSIKSPALTKEQIKKKIDSLVNASVLMKSSGYAGIEVHAMHWGYLLDEFGMALMNKRTDEYGGELEGRLLAAKEIMQGIKQVCGSDYPVTMRLGLKTYIKGFNQASLSGDDEAGRTLEEGIRICELLEGYGYDALSVDAGVYDSFYYAAPPMYMQKGHVLELSAEAKKHVKIPLLTSNRMDDPDMCEKAIAEGKTDGVVMARASLADPYFPRKVQMGKPEKIRPCIACNQGCLLRELEVGTDTCCAVNPTAGRELTYGISKATAPKKVVVVGGGVSGMEMARTATLRGHDVTLYEKSDKLGGHLISGGAHSFKADVKRLNQWYINELAGLKVNIKMNTELGAEDIKKLGADVVILTTGSKAVMPNVPGIDDAKVCSSIDALLGKKQIGGSVVVVGGGLVGCELALEYAKEGKKVTIVEMMDAILSAGEPVPIMNKMMLNDLLPYHNVDIITGHKLDSVTDTGVTIAGTDGHGSKEIAADSVVIAVGFKSLPSMERDLYETGAEVYTLGDGRKVGNVMSSIWDAYEVARMI